MVTFIRGGVNTIRQIVPISLATDKDMLPETSPIFFPSCTRYSQTKGNAEWGQDREVG
jgi:hypothetical protein